MAKYKNETDHFVKFCIPFPDGGARWFSAPVGAVIDVPAGEEWRAKDRGLTLLEEVKKPVPQPISKKKENEIIPELRKVKGLGKKTIEEISEEYNSIEEVVKAIKSNKFSVGGVDKVKQREILKVVK